jgi:hypothetical protein
VQVLITKVAPNNLIYLLENIHIFMSILDIFPKSISFLCVLEMIKEITEILFLNPIGMDLLTRPTGPLTSLPALCGPRVSAHFLPQSTAAPRLILPLHDLTYPPRPGFTLRTPLAPMPFEAASTAPRPGRVCRAARAGWLLCWRPALPLAPLGQPPQQEPPARPCGPQRVPPRLPNRGAPRLLCARAVGHCRGVAPASARTTGKPRRHLSCSSLLGPPSPVLTDHLSSS